MVAWGATLDLAVPDSLREDSPFRPIPELEAWIADQRERHRWWRRWRWCDDCENVHSTRKRTCRAAR